MEISSIFEFPNGRCVRILKFWGGFKLNSSHGPNSAMISNADSSGPQFECFVCSESDGPLYRVCKCKTLIHEQCYCRLVSVPSHATRCAICRSPYNLTLQTKSRIGCDVLTCVCVLYGILMVCASPFLLFRIWDQEAGPMRTTLILCTVMMFATGSIFSLKVCLSHWRSSGRMCCIYEKKVVVRKKIHLPEIFNIQSVDNETFI